MKSWEILVDERYNITESAIYDTIKNKDIPAKYFALQESIKSLLDKQKEEFVKLVEEHIQDVRMLIELLRKRNAIIEEIERLEKMLSDEDGFDNPYQDEFIEMQKINCEDNLDDLKRKLICITKELKKLSNKK